MASIAASNVVLSDPGKDGMIGLNSSTKVSEQELAKILAPSANWPFPANQDGWMLVHDAIRLDMKDLGAALDRMISGVQAGTPLEAWQIANAQSYMKVFYKFIHHHHHNEEEILFPWMKARTQLDDRMSTDHKTLLEMLKQCQDAINGMKVTGKAEADLKVLEPLKSTYAEMHELMLEHFKEEEDKGLPLLRMHFTAKEMVVIEKKITADSTPADLAHFLRPIEDKEAKRKIMSQLGVPGLVQTLIILPACRKYDSEVQRLCEELKQGKRIAKPSGGLFSCFSG